MLPHVIDDSQATFGEGRQILNNILVASKTIGDSKAKREGFLLKLDFKEAYDRVDWSYLDAILELKGFEPRWRR